VKTIQHTHKLHWGTYFYFMEKKGVAFGRAYIYNDQKDRIFLDSLHVDKLYRHSGYGQKMQIIREELGRKMKCKWAYLYVKKKSWMWKWYKRRGYKFVDNVKDREGFIWMKKKL